MISLNTRYRITQGELGGMVLKPAKVSRCGTFDFFEHPGFGKRFRTVRISAKHLAPIDHVEMTTMASDKAMDELRGVANSYVSTANIARIEAIKTELLSATETNIAEIEAIKAGIKQPRKTNWITVALVAYGIAATIVALVH